MAGLARNSGELVTVMDADLDDPPEAHPRLVQALGAVDAVVFARRAGRHQSWCRSLTGRLFKRFLRRVAGSRAPAGTGIFFVASWHVIDGAREVRARASYVPLLLDQAGASMRAIDVTKEPRPNTRSAYSSRRRIQLALEALRQAIEWKNTRKKGQT